MLNEPDCDLETRFSVQLLMVERTPGDQSTPLAKLERAWAAKLDKGQETALALVRRVADRPVRIKAKNAEFGSPKAAQALAAASARMKAEKEAEEAKVADEKAAAEKAAAVKAAKEEQAAAAANAASAQAAGDTDAGARTEL